MSWPGWLALALLLLLAVGLPWWISYATAASQRPNPPRIVRAADRLGGWVARHLHIDNPKHW